MVPVQWRIDLIRIIQQQGSFAQIGYVAAIISTVLLVIAWVKRGFRRGYQDIEDENDKLKAQVETTKETLSKFRRENIDLQHEVETLQARLPDTVLSHAEQEISNGNYGIAIRKLQGMFDDLSPGLAACFLHLSELASTRSADDKGADAPADAGRYRRLSALLRAAQEKTPPS